MEQHTWRNRLASVLGAAIVLILGCKNVATAQEAQTPSPIFSSKNITQKIDGFAVNPRLVENGAEVLFLVFSGDPQSPKPWDYKLSKSDRDGNSAYFLTSSGVLDYTVNTNGSGVLVLMMMNSCDTSVSSYEDIQAWELWYLDLQSEEKLLLESSSNLPLSDGYKILGLADLPNSSEGQMVSGSPQKTQKLLIQRNSAGFNFYFSFYRLDANQRRTEIFRTEAWQSYYDFEWWPSVVWLTERSFLTLRFQSLFNEVFPQSEGLFSIVKVDLISKAAVEIHSDFSIKPFPRLTLSPDGGFLVFQKFGSDKEITELWKLRLDDATFERIYAVRGELGEPRFAADGKSLVFTEVVGSHFDIIRLDLERSSIENVVGR